MKKTFFLMISAMAILFCGCSTGSGLDLLRTTNPGNALLIDSQARAPQKAAHERGVHMSFSAKSSVEINVECIFAYVQGSAFSDTTDAPSDTLNPWVRLNYSF